MGERSGRLERRDFLGLTAVLGAAAAACRSSSSSSSGSGSTPGASGAQPAATSRVRLASVPTAVEGGILPALLAEFEASHGTKVELKTATKDAYHLARDGECDLVLSHYGHKDAESFVLDGFGEWPRTVFSNQSALFGPPSDPAGVRGMGDVIEAFGRIAKAKAPYVVNALDGLRYVTDILWNGAGKPAKDGWFFDDGTSQDDALGAAAAKQGYVLWGITPFERAQKANARLLEPLVTGDPLLQRLMVTIVVRSDHVAGVNMEGARALQSFLLSAAMQAKMRSIRYPGVQQAVWAPAGRNNMNGALPKG